MTAFLWKKRHEIKSSAYEKKETYKSNDNRNNNKQNVFEIYVKHMCIPKIKKRAIFSEYCKEKKYEQYMVAKQTSSYHRNICVIYC